MVPADTVSWAFAAQAGLTRCAILARLASGEASVRELAVPFDISLQAISRHLKVLEPAGLISRGRDTQWRPCKLELSTLKHVGDWLAPYRRLLDGSVDKMNLYLTDLTKGTPDDKRS